MFNMNAMVAHEVRLGLKMWLGAEHVALYIVL